MLISVPSVYRVSKTRLGCCKYQEEGVQLTKCQTSVDGEPVGGTGEKSITGRCMWHEIKQRNVTCQG